ncbi:MAG: hypothetical protein E7056_06390 [Lentisphaerae bacterium]|nr:hypothetical protein [Lentisphaerota bacterium]
MTNKIFYKRKYAPRLQAYRGRPDCTPFLDVFFLLLIFLVLSLPFMQLSGVEVTLPNIDTGRMRTGLERFIITIAALPDGGTQLYFNDKPLDMDQLAEEMSAVSRQSDMKMVIIRADAHTTHAAVTEVMTIAARFGLSAFLATGQSEKGSTHGQEPFAASGE